jgi:hypothetical protein
VLQKSLTRSFSGSLPPASVAKKSGLAESRGRRIRHLPGSSVVAPVLFSLPRFQPANPEGERSSRFSVGELRLVRSIDLQIMCREEEQQRGGRGPAQSSVGQALLVSWRAGLALVRGFGWRWKEVKTNHFQRAFCRLPHESIWRCRRRGSARRTCFLPIVGQHLLWESGKNWCWCDHLESVAGGLVQHVPGEQQKQRGRGELRGPWPGATF